MTGDYFMASYVTWKTFGLLQSKEQVPFVLAYTKY